MPEKLLRTVGVALLSIFLVVGSLRPALAADAATWDDALAQADAANGAAEISFTSDIALTDQSQKLVVKAGNTITLSGQGTITGVGLPAIEVEPGGRLVLAGPTFTQAQFVVEGAMDFNSGTIRDTEVRGPVIFVKGGELNITGTAAFTGNDVSQGSGTPGPDGVQGDDFAPITVYNGTLNLSGGTISKNVGLVRGGAIGVWPGEGSSTINLSGGEISDNRVTNPRLYGYGGGIYADSAAVNISGGKIAKNVTERGGGLMVNKGTFNMSAGEITENNNGDFEGYGGGILVMNATSHVTGGTVSNNSANGFGGGIDFTGGQATIDGGTVSGNTALKSGGGISFAGKEASFTINAITVSGNIAKGFWGGGGIYNDNNSTLTMLNTAIINNAIAEKTYLIGAGGHPVSKQGGGLWNCPSGSSVFNITNGVAIFDNKAPDAGSNKEYAGAGDDFASVTEHFAGTPKEGQPVTLSQRLLGGGERIWYQDGSLYGIHGNWAKEKQLPRYLEGGENNRIPFDTAINENKVFKSVPENDSKELAKKLATVVIEGNVVGNDVSYGHAAQAGLGISGGGITNNGKLIFGTEDTWKLKINKAWDSDDPNTRPEKIDVEVLVGGFKVDQVHLSKDNGWTAEVLNFPNPETLIDATTGKKLPITFRESGADGYTLTFTESVDNDTKVYTYSLVNKKQTEVSVKKVWDDSDDAHKLRPTSVTVELLNRGEPAGKQLELSAENGWQGRFEELPAYLEGKPAEYSVREVAVKNYQAEVTGDVKSGYVITNKVVPPPSTPPKPGVPKTGDFGWQFAALAGLIAAGGAAIVLRRRRK